MRDEFVTCPRCGAALDPEGKRFVCTEGCGVLVTEGEVRELVLEMYDERPQALELAFEAPTHDEPVRTCPRCTTKMTKHALYAIQVDRCAEHGVWFDTDELRAVLVNVGAEHRARALRRGRIAAGAVTLGYIGVALAHLLLGL